MSLLFYDNWGQVRTGKHTPPLDARDLFLLRGFSVHVGGIDLLAGEPQLQNFDVLRPVKDFSGKQALCEDACAAEGYAQYRGDQEE